MIHIAHECPHSSQQDITRSAAVAARACSALAEVACMVLLSTPSSLQRGSEMGNL